jgi:hypothetical protein
MHLQRDVPAKTSGTHDEAIKKHRKKMATDLGEEKAHHLYKRNSATSFIKKLLQTTLKGIAAGFC